MTTHNTVYGVDYYHMDPNGCLVYYGMSPDCAVTPPPPPPPLPTGVVVPTLPNGLLTYLAAVPLNYEQVLVNWQEPLSPYEDFRLLRSRFGFPVDQNDGEVLYDSDSPAYPGNSFLDNGVIPGTYNYYAIYLLVTETFVTSTATSGSTTTLVDTNQSWSTNQFAGYTVLLTSGTGSGESAVVISNTTTTLTFATLGVAPAAATGYTIEKEVWFRSGFAACLCPWDYQSAAWIKGRIPNYFLNMPGQELTTSDPIGNPQLNQFLNIIGWGIDYLKTTMFVAQNVNHPQVVPENWLYRLADQLGMPFEPEISTGILRGAVANQSALIKQRGTLEGIEAYITQLTGWAADIRPGTNQMLEDDQAHFSNPVSPAWSSTTNYETGQQVSYSNYVFTSLQNNNLNNTPPTGTPPTSTAWWGTQYFASNNTLLENPATGWMNTWEPRQIGAANQVAGAGALTEAVGILDRTHAGVFLKNGLMVTNTSGSSATMDLQSISRTTADITSGLAYANRTQVLGDGLPVPFTIPQQAWSATVQYPTGAIVSYNGQPFTALKSSKNVKPPTNNVPTLEWQPIGLDSRIALVMSAYTMQAPSNTTASAIQPYAAWYDQYGNHITTVTPRQTSNYPANLMYHSFSKSSTWGTALAGDSPDVGSYTWSAVASTFTVNGFENGCIYPSALSTRTEATVSYTGSASLQLGLTFLTMPSSGMSMGLIVRKQDDSNYIRIDQAKITKVAAGVKTTLQAHSTAFAAGDRMIVTLNGSTIIVYRYNAPTINNPVNLVQVSTDGSGYLSTQTTHGVIVEAT